MKEFELPSPAVTLGLMGIVPQASCLILVVMGEPYRWIGLAAGCFYAAIILSFLGGMWWMAALLEGRKSAAIYMVAVLPSLAGWAALLPWVVGWSWPGPSLIALGIILLASPIIESKTAGRIKWPVGWLRLRVIMASGLGTLTLALTLL